MNEPTPRWKQWANSLKDVELKAEEVRDQRPRWDGIVGEGGEATIDAMGMLTIDLRGKISDTNALSLAQFIVNWYAPTPISIL